MSACTIYLSQTRNLTADISHRKRYLYIIAGIPSPREMLFWRTNTKIHKGCVMALLPSNLRSLLLKQSPLDVAWRVLCTERTTVRVSIPSKPQKKFSHPLGNSLHHEKVKSHYEKWDKEQWHIRTTFCCYKKKGQTEALPEIWYSEGTNPQTSMGQVSESSSGTPEPPDIQRPL